MGDFASQSLIFLYVKNRERNLFAEVLWECKSTKHMLGS